MEQYLIDEYDVHEDKVWLTDESQIEDYFMDAKDLFDCGQGYYEEEVDLICKVGDRFYQVDIQAEIASAKQDVGDRLHWVDNIVSVKYEEIPKPEPKERTIVKYELNLAGFERRRIEKLLVEMNVDF